MARFYTKKGRPDTPYGFRRADELTGWRLDLFSNNHRLAFAGVKLFRTRLRMLRIDYDDAGQIALCGLWNAAALFDPARGFTFGTLAMRCVKRALLELVDSTQRDRDRWAGMQFHGSDSVVALNVAAPPEMPTEPEWIDEVPAQAQAVIRRRLAGATWVQIAAEFGYANTDSARVSTKIAYNRMRRVAS